MQIDGCINRYKDYTNIRLTSRSGLFQEYEIKMPQTEATKIVLVDVTGWLDKQLEGQYLCKGSVVGVEKIDDLRRWIYGLAIVKKMREISDCSKEQCLIFSPFDALIWNLNEQLYGAYTVQIQKTSRVAKVKSQLSLALLKKFYRSQMADYHSFNIVLQTIEADCLRWDTNKKRPILRLSKSWRRLDFQEGHWRWIQLKQDPYSDDFEKLQQALKNIANAQQQQNEQQQQSLYQSRVLRIKQLFKAIYQQSYDQFTKKYVEIFHTQFILKDHLSFATNLKQFYTLRYDHNNLTEILNQQKSQLQTDQAINSISIQRIHSAFLEEKMSHSEYPAFVEKALYGLGKKESLENILNLMPKETKEDRVRWHFLKAKIQWKNGNFYRALAHLRQAEKQTNDPKLLYVIKFQEARNWQHLCQNEKAESNYKQSLAYAQQAFGSSYPLLLAVYYNLKMLYYKQGKIEEGDRLDYRIGYLRKIHSMPKFKKMPELAYAKVTESIIQSYSVTAKTDKQQKSLPKAELMKLQTERLPFLVPIWGHFKSMLDKNRPQRVPNFMQIQQSHNYLGQLKVGMYFLALLSYVQGRTSTNLVQQMIEDIEQQLDAIQRSNIKNYHRFLFLLSFYYEKKQPVKAAECIQKILAMKSIVYSKVVRFSLVKRLAYLYKLNNHNQKLLKLYRTQNVIQSGDMQCLFDFIQLSAQSQHYPSVITSGRAYLNSIRQYQTESNINKARQTGRLLDRSFEVKLLIFSSLGKLRCFEDLAKMMDEIEKDLNDSSRDIRIFISALRQLCFESYKSGQCQLCYSLIQKMIHYDCIRQQQPQIISKQSPEKKYCLSLVDVDQIYQIYRSVVSKMSIEPLQADLRWFQTHSQYRNDQNIKSECGKDDQLDVTCKPITLHAIVEQLHNQLKQRQPKFTQIFTKFDSLVYPNNLRQLVEQLIWYISHFSNMQGTKSFINNIMHILMLIVSLKQEQKVVQMYLLYWLSSFKFNFDMPEDKRDYWTSKEGRDLRLDELLCHYFEDQMEQHFDCQVLCKLSWFKSVREELLNLKRQYKEIVDSQLGTQDQKLLTKLIHFCIKYSAFFDCNLQESDTLVKIKEIQAQLDCPDDDL